MTSEALKVQDTQNFFGTLFEIAHSNVPWKRPSAQRKGKVCHLELSQATCSSLITKRLQFIDYVNGILFEDDDAMFSQTLSCWCFWLSCIVLGSFHCSWSEGPGNPQFLLFIYFYTTSFDSVWSKPRPTFICVFFRLFVLNCVPLDIPYQSKTKITKWKISNSKQCTLC